MSELHVTTSRNQGTARGERVLHLDLRPDRAEWAMFMACVSRLRRLDARPGNGEEIPVPFLAVTPEGLSERVRLRDSLLLSGIHVLRRMPIPNWARARTILSVHRFDEDALLLAWAEEEVWRMLHPEGRAECWFLWSPRVCRRLDTDLGGLLPDLPERRSRVTVRDRSFPLALPCIHVPGEEGLEPEFRRLRWILDNS